MDRRRLLRALCVLPLACSATSGVQGDPEVLVPNPPGPFVDVPKADPAYTTVRLLHDECGVFSGYPVDTFNGRRALTRYEFGVSVQRMWTDLDRRLDPPAPPARLKGKFNFDNFPVQRSPRITAREKLLLQSLSDEAKLTRVIKEVSALALRFENELKMLGAKPAAMQMSAARWLSDVPGNAARMRRELDRSILIKD